ncbi:MAG: hypothetical protein IPM82_22150 [Saprospiraceae bacterium]|nr:hypothetical protein [Saprospiraceae bacterium]
MEINVGGAYPADVFQIKPMMHKIHFFMLTFCFAIFGETLLLSQSLNATNLPIVLLETNGQPIDFQKINA